MNPVRSYLGGKTQFIMFCYFQVAFFFKACFLHTLFRSLTGGVHELL